MGMQWTEEQKSAIVSSGSDLLLSAAAGSGKTAVLVERILTKITDPARPVDIDRLLVVTFTNAAAAQMRERISAALEARLEEDPENAHLQRQAVLIHHASIMTIHSFCLQVIRSNSSRSPLEPDFRIPDEGERSLLARDVAGEVIEEAYSKADPDFLALSEMFAEGKTSDAGLEDALLEVYEYSLADPQPAKWRGMCAALYEQAGQEDAGEHPWMREICGRLRVRILDLKEKTEEMLRLSQDADGPWFYADAIASDLQLLEDLAGCASYADYAKVLADGVKFKTLGRGKDDGVSPEKKAKVKEIRDAVKKEIGSLREKYFYEPEEKILEDLAAAAAPARALIDLADRFGEAFEKKKREKNLADFGDLEHFAMEILVDFGEDGPAPTASALALRRYYEEVMIDEYQDSNLVQELLLWSVSRTGGGADRFMVGDVKQSIYRFRLARPEIFLEKYRAYREEGTGRCIHLRSNFRSRTQVLDAVNFVFDKVMTPALGGIDYDEDAALYPGASYPEPEKADDYVPEVILIDPSQAAEDAAAPQDAGEGEEGGSGEDESLENLDLKRAEALAAARKIRQIVGTLPVWDGAAGAVRPAGYGDIAVLLRTVSGWAQPFTDVFTQEGIPVYSGSGAGYFSAMEIRTILSFLQVLDNPRQDIPLAASLRSPIGSFTDGELAQIRCAGAPEDDLYTCCMLAMEKGGAFPAEKLSAFFDLVLRLRELVPYTPVDRLLWIIFDETGYLDYASALPGGAVRRANLEMLTEKAAEFEKGSYSGLYQFIRYIELLKRYEVDYGEAPPAEDAGETVRLMSIHKSKGLEFPVVLICGLGKSFNRSDAYGKIAMHHELGLGFDLRDPGLRVKTPLLSKSVIGSRILDESLGEELRVLYVAMTRAKEKLVMIGTSKVSPKKAERWEEQSLKEKLSYSELSAAGTFLDWLMPPVLAGSRRGIFRLSEAAPENPDAPKKAAAHDAGRLHDALKRAGEAAEPFTDPETAERMRFLLSREMPHGLAAKIPGKVSVSEIKHAAIEEAAVEEGAELLFPDPVPVPLVPKFIGGQEEKAGGGAARGTAMHRVMEVIDFSAAPSGDFLDSVLESLLMCGKIQNDVLSLIDREKVRTFLDSPLAGRMREADRRGTLVREQPFTLGVPASRIRPEWPGDEEVLVQGIIDAYFAEDDGIVLLDYKTDYLPGGDESILVGRYRVQLSLYREALERLTGQRVKEMLLYSFFLGRQIEVK